MTLGEAENIVSHRLGARDDLQEAGLIRRFLEAAILQLGETYGVPDLEKFTEFVIPFNQFRVKILDLFTELNDFIDLQGIRMIKLTDENSFVESEEAGKLLKYDLKRPYGRPTRFARWGSEILFYPVPSKDYPAHCLYWRSLRIESGVRIPLYSNYHWPCVLLATSIGWDHLQNPQMANEEFNNMVKWLSMFNIEEKDIDSMDSRFDVGKFGKVSLYP